MAQLKELIRTGLFALIVLCGVTGCDKEDEEFKDSSYTLDKLEWAVGENDVVETLIDIPERIYINDSDIELPVTVCAFDNYTQTSQFFSDDPNLFQRLTQQLVNVYIPSGEYASDGFFQTFGGPEVPLSLEEYLYPPHSFCTHTTEMPPQTMLIQNATITESKVTATYRALFTGNDTGKQIEVMGTWKGTYYTKHFGVLEIKDIK